MCISADIVEYQRAQEREDDELVINMMSKDSKREIYDHLQVGTSIYTSRGVYGHIANPIFVINGSTGNNKSKKDADQTRPSFH